MFKKNKNQKLKKINIVGHNRLWLTVTFLMVIFASVALAIWRLNLGIDFKGGTVLEYKFSQSIDRNTLSEVITSQGKKVERIVQAEGNAYIIYMEPVTEDERRNVENAIQATFSDAQRESVETIGASVGDELKKKAFTAVIFVSLGIIVYLAYSFRNVPKPYSSWEFGISAIIAMLHDIIFVLGVFAALGHFFGVEIDSLFVTALLTVIGFSVHDTIVVFDRVRENLKKNPGDIFDKIVNNSLIETIARSVNLSMTVIITLIALLILGGPSIRWFVFALLVGMTSGAYSSIFVASQVLVVWEKIKTKRGLGGVNFMPKLKGKLKKTQVNKGRDQKSKGKVFSKLKGLKGKLRVKK